MTVKLLKYWFLIGSTITILPSDWSPVSGSHGAGLGGQHACARALEVCLAATLRQRTCWGMTMLMFSIHLVVQLLPVETLYQVLLRKFPEAFSGPHMGLLLKQLLYNILDVKISSYACYFESEAYLCLSSECNTPQSMEQKSCRQSQTETR